MNYYIVTENGYIKRIELSNCSSGQNITEAEYNALLAEIRTKAALVNKLYNGEITIDAVPVEWQEEIQRRVTERQEAEAEPDPEQSEMDDMAAALTLLGVTPEEG